MYARCSAYSASTEFHSSSYRSADPARADVPRQKRLCYPMTSHPSPPHASKIMPHSFSSANGATHASASHATITTIMAAASAAMKNFSIILTHPFFGCGGGGLRPPPGVTMSFPALDKCVSGSGSLHQKLMLHPLPFSFFALLYANF